MFVTRLTRSCKRKQYFRICVSQVYCIFHCQGNMQQSRSALQYSIIYSPVLFRHSRSPSHGLIQSTNLFLLHRLLLYGQRTQCRSNVDIFSLPTRYLDSSAHCKSLAQRTVKLIRFTVSLVHLSPSLVQLVRQLEFPWLPAPQYSYFFVVILFFL